MDDMNLIELVEQFADEAKCRAHLAELRWPDGPRCLRCKSAKINGPSKRHLYECAECSYQFSVKVGTIFNDSKLPLWKWFVAVYLMVESKKGMSANQLKRTLGVSYKTAWYLCHRIRSTMTDETGELLTGIVEMDETYIGGKPRYHHGTANKGSRSNMTMVLGAVERGGRVRLKAMPRPYATNAVVDQFAAENIADDAEAIYTDESQAYSKLGDRDTRHESVNHRDDEWVRGQIHTNTVESVWSLFDRSVIGAYHKLSVKHLPAYLDEAAFRWNNRSNPFLFRDTLLALVNGETLTYAKLIA